MEVEFLGMIVGRGCIRMDPAKLSAIAAWPPPKTVKAVRALLGFCNFYHKFIPNFSNLVAPLTALTAKLSLGLGERTNNLCFPLSCPYFKLPPYYISLMSAVLLSS